MEKTFLDVLSHFNYHNDKSSILFLKYVMKKYFDEKKIFMSIKDAIPFLEKHDRDQLTLIMEEVPNIN